MDKTQPTLSLADLAGINLSEVAEVRFENIPEMGALFEITAHSLEAIDRGEKMKGPGVIYDFSVKECVSLVDSSLKKEEMVGKVQKQTFMLRNLEDIGRFKAFLTDCGVQIPDAMPLPDIIPGVVGLAFTGKSVHKKNTNDPDKPYCNIQPVVQKATA